MDSQEIERELVEIAFDAFNRTGEWPTVSQVHMKAVRQGIRVQSYDVFHFFNRRAGAATDDSPTTLGVSDLVDLPEAEWLLNEFVHVVLLSVKKFMEGSEDKPQITSDDLRDTLLLDDKVIKQLYALIQRSIFLTRGGGGTGSKWQFFIGPDIHFFKDVKNIRDYLAEVERLRFPAVSSSEPEQPTQTEIQGSNLPSS
jgi:hypothetical protein